MNSINNNIYYIFIDIGSYTYKRQGMYACEELFKQKFVFCDMYLSAFY